MSEAAKDGDPINCAACGKLIGTVECTTGSECTKLNIICGECSILGTLVSIEMNGCTCKTTALTFGGCDYCCRGQTINIDSLSTSTKRSTTGDRERDE